MKKRHIIVTLSLLLCAGAAGRMKRSPRVHRPHDKTRTEESVRNAVRADRSNAHSDTMAFRVDARGDTIRYAIAADFHKGSLTEEDYREVARDLGVDVAAIKAVVDIEAGTAHQGFWTDGKPIINFDLSMFRQAARRHGINLAKYSHSHSIIFSRPNAARYGGQQAAVQARLDAARSIHDTAGIEGTFWGMFQIGGFNWKICGCSSAQDFVRRMSRSERDQLDIFAAFMRSTGLLKHLQAKNWSAFARGYNGNSYAARGYHTRLAAAYHRHGGH